MWHVGEAWGDNQQALFEEAQVLNAQRKLFGFVNANSTRATMGLHPATQDKVQVAHNVDNDEGNEGDKVDEEHPEWHECHGDDNVVVPDDREDALVVGFANKQDRSSCRIRGIESRHGTTHIYWLRFQDTNHNGNIARNLG